MSCVLCEPQDEIVLWRNADCRVIRVDDPAYPGFCRVIWHAHVREMTDLNTQARQQFMTVVWAVEWALRECLSPEKINLASLGNQVAHLHWHVIPRFVDDTHFPDPVWAQARRVSKPGTADWGKISRALAAQLAT